MESEYIKLLAIIVALICFGVSIFQMLLVLGLPLGDYAWGGKYRVLPMKLRISSVISFVVLSFIGFIYLQNVNVVNTSLGVLNNKVFIWIFSVLFALNSVGNLCSKSKKEKLIMTPITIIATVLSIIIASNI